MPAGLFLYIMFLSLHNFRSLSDGAGSKYLHLEVVTGKFDLELDRTSLKCMGVVGSSEGAGKL